jgi:hypothetical protein
VLIGAARGRDASDARDGCWGARRHDGEVRYPLSLAMSRISLRTRNRCQLRNRAVLVDGLARYLPPRSVSDAFCGIAVDHEGEVLDAVVTATRDKRAVLTVLKRLLKRHGRPRQIVTHGLPMRLP